ncbi:PAS domain S-box protein [Halobacterium bonnevillei]|uniref:histidine kinase n=1 Tax=Halobacterium bonnevillei TaxID=2692200 RepID=A0A6B0SRI3_9EURY|nr:PAS domain S-box protein [Halobacterium bonnevillei]MXR21460.1 PAS domain S-box protein [Halobacterium bonnevillei]
MSVDTTTERLAAFFNNSPDAILVVQREGVIRRANARVEEIFGYAPEELEGELIEVLVPDAAEVDHPEKREAYFESAESRPMGAGLELRAEHRDGTTFPVDVSLSPIQTDGETEVIAAVRDRSERERLQQKYRTVMQTAPDATFVIDATTGEIIEVNEAATELLDAPAATLVGAHVTSLHPSEESQRYRELFHAHPEGEQKTIARFENGDDVLVEPTDGDHVPVEISAQHLELQGQEVVVAMFRDVSERRRYERDLYHQIDRLERLAEVLSHDLRNPLNVAEGNLELAAETGDTSRLNEVERAHDRMRDIIEDALTMVRGGSEVESVEPLELSGIAWKCWRNVATAHASLSVDANGLVYADDTRATHLFENLFRNAVEHGGDDVTVTVGVFEGGFYVADDGPGIPPEQRKSVTESGWTTSSTGSGLGLSIVADIAAAHDWTFTVTESASGGARFEFADVRTAPYDDAYTQDADKERSLER